MLAFLVSNLSMGRYTACLLVILFVDSKGTAWYLLPRFRYSQFHHAIQLPVGGLGNIKTNFGSQKKGLSFNLLNGQSVSSVQLLSAAPRPVPLSYI